MKNQRILYGILCVLVMGLLAKMMELTAIAIQRAAVDLYNTARGWWRWAVR